MRRTKFAICLMFASILLAACAKETPESVTYAIEMSEYSFSPDTIEAKVGQQVTLVLSNKGVLEHELMIGREMMVMDNRPNGFRTDMFAMAHVEPQVTIMQGGMDEMGEADHGANHSGFMVTLPKSNDQASLTFTVTDDMLGEWEIGCFSQEGVHYDAGMKGKFVISR
jgi:uncharacterized cupredoxin-like copper-binding protein